MAGNLLCCIDIPAGLRQKLHLKIVLAVIALLQLSMQQTHSQQFSKLHMQLSCWYPQQHPSCTIQTDWLDWMLVHLILPCMLCCCLPQSSLASAGQQLITNIRQFRPNLSEPFWRNVSADAKHLVELLLCKRPAQRVTLAVVVQKPWIRSGGFANGNILLSVATLLRKVSKTNAAIA